MGICPQHNVLFDRLTVKEHLYFFQKIKGINPTNDDLISSADEVGLNEYHKTTSITLSGGNKRKLSLAIALSGDPNFLLLDEPTSGMDVASRRHCWELLRRKREGRVILLTTHFLDEASLLSDRIAIMKEGKLQCCGSELFLKSRYGLGYNLTAVLDCDSAAPLQYIENLDRGREGFKGSRNDAAHNILVFLNGVVPETSLIRQSARELTFRFPRGAENQFPEVFNRLDEEYAKLGIGSYGISDTTLEEIFLLLAEQEISGTADAGGILSGDEFSTGRTQHYSLENTSKNLPNARNDKDISAGKQKEINQLNADLEVSKEYLQHLSPLRQIVLLYSKRFIYQRRDIKGAFFHIVLPVILCGLILLILTFEIPLIGPPMKMSMNLYERPTSGTGKALTDVVVGGGVSFQEDPLSTSLEEEFEYLGSSFSEQYPNARIVHLKNFSSSGDLSNHLLDTYNDKDHHERYGSFALFDRINLNIQMNWSELRQELRKLHPLDLLSNFLGLDGTSLIELAEVLGTANGSVIDFSIGGPQGFDSSSLDPFLFYNKTQEVLTTIGEVTTPSDPKFGSMAVAQVQAALQKIVNASLSITEQDLGIEAAAVTFFSDVLSITTRGEIKDFENTTAEEIAAVFIEQEEIFDRSLIVDGMFETFEVLFTPFGIENTTSRAIANLVVALFDQAASSFLSNNVTSIPNDVLIFPVVMLDELGRQLVENGEAFDLLMGIFGNSTFSAKVDSMTLDLQRLVVSARDVSLEISLPNLHLKAKMRDTTFNVTSMTLSVDGFSLELNYEPILKDFDIEFEFEVGDFGIIMDLLPDQIVNYRAGINTAASILHNSSSPHAVAAFNQAYLESMFQKCTGDTVSSRLVSINHPLPLTKQQTIEIRTILSILAGLFLLVPYCYIPGAFVVFLVKERVSKSKHLQLVSGVDLTSYWVSTYLWDLTLFIFITALLILVFFLYGTNVAAVFVGDRQSTIASALLTFGYGLSILPFSYLLSRTFNNHSSAQIAVMVIVFVCGFVAVNGYYIMTTLEQTRSLAATLLPFFRCWPSFNVGDGFIRLSQAYWERQILGVEKYPLDWDVTGLPIVLLYSQSVPYFLTLLFLEYSADGGSGGFIGRIIRKISAVYTSLILRTYGITKNAEGISVKLDDHFGQEFREDEDVIKERNFVRENKSELISKASIVIYNMWKIFPPSVGIIGRLFHCISSFFCCRCFQSGLATDDEDEVAKSSLPKKAVSGVSTAIMPGETYGLLGGKFSEF